MISTTSPSMPDQRIPDSQKTPSWYKSCHEWLSTNLLYNINFNLNSKYASNRLLFTYGIISKAEIASIVNPFKLTIKDIPDNLKNYPITNSHIKTLQGEVLKRRFDWSVTVTSRDAISDKEKEKASFIDQFLMQQIQQSAQSEEQLNQLVQDFQDDVQTFQDRREIGSTELLTYYWHNLECKRILDTDLWDKEIIEGKGVVNVDEFNNRPYVEVLSPDNVYYLKNPNSEFVEDMDAVCFETYMSVSEVKDRYYDELTPKDIDYLDRRIFGPDVHSQISPSAYYGSAITEDGRVTFAPIEETTAKTPYPTSQSFGGYFDTNGNVRVLQTRWKGNRKVGVVTFPSEQGMQQKMVADDYKIDTSLGETVKWIYITEAYESHQIGEEIFVKQQVRNLQYRKLDNKSYCNLGIIALELDQSIFDLMKQYQILYNVYMHKLETTFNKTQGNIGIIDVALLPEGITAEMAMYYGTQMGFMLVDSFKEGKKGAATGKLAGNMSSQQRQITIENYQLITECFNMLNHIRQELDRIVGINDQRRGQIGTDAGLGTTQEAIQASSNITEVYFYKHEQLKLKVLRLLLENAKFCLRNKSEVINYVASDAAIKTFQLDGEMINEADYNVSVLNANIDGKTESMLQEGVKIGFQTGQVNLEQMLDVYSNESIAAIRRKLKQSMRKNAEVKRQNEQAQREHEQQLADKQNEQLELDRQLKRYDIETKAATQIAVANIGIYARQQELDQDNNGLIDASEIASNALKQQEINQKNFDAERNHILKIKESEDKKSIEKEKLNAHKQIEAKKLEAIKVQNQSQEKLALLKHKNDKEMMQKKLAIEKIKARKKATAK
jgi:hypothetical protein